MFLETELNGIRVFSFSELFQIPNFIYMVSSRQTDSDLLHSENTSDSARKQSLSELAGVKSENVFTLRQVHSAQTVVLDDAGLGLEDRELGPADGVIVTRPGLFAVVRTADCVPVVVVFPKGNQVALFHMGWRGAKERILEKGLRKFLSLTGATPDEIKTAIGPFIRSCCYEVGDEVRKAFENAGFRCDEVFQDRSLDLVSVDRAQLAECGVTEFLDSGLCTSCRNDLFYSYRRGRTVSRMWTLAGFKG